MKTHISKQVEKLKFAGDWQAEFLQLSAGPLLHSYSVIDLGQVVIERIRCAASVQVLDVHDVPYHSFGIVTESDGPSRFLGHEMQKGDTIVWRPNDPFDYEYVTPTNFGGFIVMVKEEAAKERGWSARPARLFKATAEGHQTLETLCDSLFNTPVLQPAHLGDVFIKALEGTYGTQLFVSQNTSEIEASAEIRKLVALARQRLTMWGSEELDNMDELADQLGVSRRRLYRAFRQWPGIGPARYSRILRLAAALCLPSAPTGQI